MNKNLIFEKISKENFNDFLFLVKKLAEYEKLDPPNKEAEIRLKKDGLSKNPKYEAYICRIDQKPVGYLIFFMTYSSFLASPIFYLEDIFILEQYRREGFGNKMFKFCIKIAKERKCGRLEWCVLNWNKIAINFYEQFKPVNICKNWTYYRLDKEQIEIFSH